MLIEYGSLRFVVGLRVSAWANSNGKRVSLLGALAHIIIDRVPSMTRTAK